MGHKLLLFHFTSSLHVTQTATVATEIDRGLHLRHRDVPVTAAAAVGQRGEAVEIGSCILVFVVDAAGGCCVVPASSFPSADSWVLEIAEQGPPAGDEHSVAVVDAFCNFHCSVPTHPNAGFLFGRCE